MKRINLLFLSFILIGLVSCIKNDPVEFTGALVEFDATTWNTNTAYTPQPDSIAFAIMTRVPVPGRAATTADATLSRTSGDVSLRVNLVGAQRSTPTEINYTVVTNYTLISPVAGVSPAVAGTHYGPLSGKVTIPANSSFGTLTVPILNPGAGTGSRELVLRLQEANGVRPNRNYSIVGLRISQQ
ncbi:MAG TPA: hypothetical protein VMR70_08655 [Flavisolibacter sp.]|nr:hypothetical protein [Flavisolibacter sp.]